MACIFFYGKVRWDMITQLCTNMFAKFDVEVTVAAFSYSSLGRLVTNPRRVCCATFLFLGGRIIGYLDLGLCNVN